MGEYIQRADGVVIKIGTCEDLFYVSLPYLRQLVAEGAQKYPGNLAPSEYLDPSPGWRYRFPWPDEAGTGDDHKRARVVTVPPGWWAGLEDHAEVSHYMTPIAYGRNTSGYAVSIRTACPLSETPPATWQPVPQIVEIYEQKQVDGLLWTVCRCPYCGNLWRMEPGRAADLVAHLRTAYGDAIRQRVPADDWTLLIADLVEAGYTL